MTVDETHSEMRDRHFRYDFVRAMLDDLPDDAREQLRETVRDRRTGQSKQVYH